MQRAHAIARRSTVALTCLLLAVLVQPGSATSAHAETCEVVVPKRVVLRASGIQSAVDIGARWGRCAQDFKEYGYYTSWYRYLPGPVLDQRPKRWLFTGTKLWRPPATWRPDALVEGTIPITAFGAEQPNLVDMGTGGDYSALLPGWFAFAPQATQQSADTNFPGMRLTSRSRFVAKYWSGLSISAEVTRSKLVVNVIGLRDTMWTFEDGSPVPGTKAAPAHGAKVRIYRNGRGIGTVTLDSEGRGTLRMPATTGAASLRAIMASSPTNWAAFAKTTARPTG